MSGWIVGIKCPLEYLQVLVTTLVFLLLLLRFLLTAKFQIYPYTQSWFTVKQVKNKESAQKQPGC